MSWLFSILWERVRYLLTSFPAWLVFGSAFALSIVGVWAIQTVEPAYAHKQLTFWLPGSIVFASLLLLPQPARMNQLSNAFLAVSVMTLAYLFIPGAPQVREINGAISWIDLKVMRFQPAEMAKVAFIMALASYLCYRQSHRTWRGLLGPAAIMLVPQGLILVQPDLGSALLFPPTLASMLLASGAKLRHLITLTTAGLVVGSAVFINTVFMPESSRILKHHQQVRIQAIYYAWKNDDRMANAEGFQQATGMRLIAAGGSDGYRDKARDLIHANALPEDHNDMIYCVVASRWGYVGSIVVVGLYVLMAIGMVGVAARSQDPFARLCCIGFAALFFAQMVVNVGMCLGLLPITGLTLPFISYGGSSLLFAWGMVGLVLNFASQPRARRSMRPAFEF